MSAGDEQMLDEILILDRGRTAAGPATALGLIIRQRLGLCVTAVRDGDNAIFFSNQVLNRQIVRRIRNLRFAIVPEFFYQFLQLLADD